MTKLEFTGERFVPGKSPPLIEAEHRARYAFAQKHVEQRRVLDLGCGEGYGSHMLSEVAELVVGVDIDDAAIQQANATYSAPNLDYRVADVAGLPFADGEFSACVCFEVLEHIENPKAILDEAARVLAPRGVFLISTPNGAVKVSSSPNPFHIREYTLPELGELLRVSFPQSEWDLEIHGQFVRGRLYSALGVALKNAYLTLKGSLGLSQPLEERHTGPNRPPAPTIEFDFRADRAQLAEYLVAIITGRG